MNINSSPEIYDAIVVGSGISGGWAAKELCESGLKTLLLERGRPVEHIKDYPTAIMDPWEFKTGIKNAVADVLSNNFAAIAVPIKATIAPTIFVLFINSLAMKNSNTTAIHMVCIKRIIATETGIY